MATSIPRRRVQRRPSSGSSLSFAIGSSFDSSLVPLLRPTMLPFVLLVLLLDPSLPPPKKRPSSSSSSSPFDPSSLSSPSLDSVHIMNLTCGLFIDPYHYHSFDVVSRNHAGWNTPISLYVGAFRYCAFCSVRLGFAGGIGIGGDDDDENEE